MVKLIIIMTAFFVLYAFFYFYFTSEKEEIQAETTQGHVESHGIIENTQLWYLGSTSSSNQGLSWYNFQTEEYDYIDSLITDWTPYIPQFPAALNLYRLRLKVGDTPINAAIYVYNSFPDKEN